MVDDFSAGAIGIIITKIVFILSTPSQIQDEPENGNMATQAEDIIAECLTQVQSDSVQVRTAALHTLSTLTKLSSHNRNLLALSPDALALLLSLPLSDSTALPLSLSVLLHLSLNPNLKQPLASAAASTGFLPLLNTILRCPSATPQAATLAASLLCSLAMHDKNKGPLGVSGVVDAIIAALESSTSTTASAAGHHLLSSLAELAQFHGNCTLAVRAGAVPVLARILGGGADDLVGTSAIVLERLARFEEGFEAIRMVEGVVWLLVEGLKSGCMVSRESAMELLVRLLEENGERMREAAGREEFCALLADLSIRGSTNLREKAALLMKMIEDAALDCHLLPNGEFVPVM